MITRQQVIRKADDDGVSALAVERDYVLSHCLYAIAASPESARFVFKGGTALRMCYFDDYRYSADLDLGLAVGFLRAEAREAIGDALRHASQEIGFPTLRIVPDTGSKIEYEGPLGRVRGIKLDLDEDELVLSSARLPLLRRYPDVAASEGLPTYSLVEIAAEKLRCVIQRLQCRDFYDLYQLLEGRPLDANEVWETFEVKARHKNIDPEGFFQRFDARVSQYEDRWIDEMGEQVPGELLAFETALRQLRRRLRPSGHDRPSSRYWSADLDRSDDRRWRCLRLSVGDVDLWVRGGFRADAADQRPTRCVLDDPADVAVPVNALAFLRGHSSGHWA